MNGGKPIVQLVLAAQNFIDSVRNYAKMSSYYIETKEKEIEEFNKQNNIDTSNLVNGRRQTNIGVFRAYLTEYLKQNQNLNHNLTMLVRQKDPTEFGVPMQIYCFSSKTDWISYEAIQNDIFDHIYAVINQFDLKVYQRPSSYSINLMNDK